MSVRQKRPTVLTAATTHWALTPVCVALPMSWDLMENSVTVSLNPLDIIKCTESVHLVGTRYLNPYN